MGSGGKITLRIAVACLWTVIGSAVAAGECRVDQVFVRGDWGQVRFSVEVADDKKERAKGLMHRENMPKSSGMLFVYPESKMVGFWMKNTLIPLDMLFLDSTGTVQHVHHMAKPHDETPIFGGNNIIAVLEINGGLAKMLGIVKGSQMRHPAFETEVAAWPC